MRYLLTISMLLFALVGIAQDVGGSSYTSTRTVTRQVPDTTMDPLEVEEEFKKIYLDFCKRRHYPVRYSDFLDTVVIIHLNYLTNHEENMITHHQLDVPKYRTVGDRLYSVYPYHVGDYAEIAIMGNISTDNTPRQEAQLFFDSFMKSTGHRKIMIQKKFRSYAFKFKYNIHGWMVGVGVFTEIRRYD